jgi:hypothetical protein
MERVFKFTSGRFTPEKELPVLTEHDNIFDFIQISNNGEEVKIQPIAVIP